MTTHLDGSSKAYSPVKSESEVAQSCPTLCNPMEFSRQEYWSGLPFPSPGALPDPEIEPRSPTLQADALPSEARSKSSQASPQADSITQKSAKPRGNVII